MSSASNTCWMTVNPRIISPIAVACGAVRQFPRAPHRQRGAKEVLILGSDNSSLDACLFEVLPYLPHGWQSKHTDFKWLAHSVAHGIRKSPYQAIPARCLLWPGRGTHGGDAGVHRSSHVGGTESQLVEYHTFFAAKRGGPWTAQNLTIQGLLFMDSQKTGSSP